MSSPSNLHAENCPRSVDVIRYANDISMASTREFEEFTTHLEQCDFCAKTWSQQCEENNGWQHIEKKLMEITSDSFNNSNLDESLTRIRLALSREIHQKSTPLQIGGFELVEVIGRGATSTVYRAHQATPYREVALKHLFSAFPKENQLKRFRVEIDALAKLKHPNIVPILEVGQSANEVYFTMPLIEGGSLANRLDGTPWNPTFAAKLMHDVASAIELAHRSGIIHRDLKPGNILMDINNDRSNAEHGGFLPLVTDFGVAKPIEGATLTKTGELIGTPSYMAPEQIKGNSSEIGPAVDIYSMGINLYELLTGRSPFKAESATQTLLEIVNEDPLPPSRINKRIPRDLETICLRAIEKRPSDRYESAASFRMDLARFLEQKPIIARPVGNLERAYKWTRRRPMTATLLAATFVVAAILLTMWAMFTWQIRQQRDHIQETATQLKLERKQALANFDRAFTAVHQYMHSVHNNPQLGDEKLIDLRKELLQHGTEFYEDMIQDNEAVAILPAARHTTEKVRLEQARLFFTVGKLQYITEDFVKAKQSFERALEICLGILGNELIPSRKVDAGLPGSVLVSLARTEISLGEYEAALFQADRARNYFHAVSNLEQLPIDYQRWYLTDTYLAKALAYSNKESPDEALQELEAGIDIARELPAVPDFYLPLARMLLERIKIYSKSDSHILWSKDLAELQSITQQLTATAPEGLRYLSVRAEYFAAHSQMFKIKQDWVSAKDKLQKAIQLQEKLFLSRPYESIARRLNQLKQMQAALTEIDNQVHHRP